MSVNEGPPSGSALEAEPKREDVPEDLSGTETLTGDPSQQEEAGADKNGGQAVPNEAVDALSIASLRFQGSTAAEGPPAADARSAVIRKASNDLLLLIAHICRHGKLGTVELTPILKIAKKAAKSELTEEDEGQFWREYAALVALARPASVDSLHIEKYAGSLGWPPESDGGRRRARWLPFASRSAINQHLRTLSVIRVLAVIVFAITLLLVAYLTFTEGILKKNDELTREYALLAGNSVAGTQIEHIILAYRDAAAPPRQPGVVAPRAGSIEGGQPTAAISPANNAELGTTTGQNRATDGLEDTREKYLIGSRRAEITASVSYNDSLLRRFLPDWLTKLPASVEATGPFQLLPLETPIRTLQQSINEMLSRYLLPMLAAALGVFVFILRTASAQFKELSFVASDVSNYWPRIILGIVAGLVIGWFLGQEPTGVLATISPAAIAFITGYSVEIFFNLLDSIIKALGAGSKESA